MNPVIGNIDCPLCAAVGRQTVATVHQERRAKRALYWRCDSCGTLQPRLSGGQAAMQQLTRPLKAGPEQDGAATEAAIEAQEDARHQIRKQRRSSRLGSAIKNLLIEDEN